MVMCKHAYNKHFFGYHLGLAPFETADLLVPHVVVADWSPKGCLLQNGGTSQAVGVQDSIDDVLLRMMRLVSGKTCRDRKDVVIYSHMTGPDGRTYAPYYLQGIHVQLLSNCPGVATALLRIISPNVQKIWQILVSAYGSVCARHTFTQYFGVFGGELPHLHISYEPKSGLAYLTPGRVDVGSDDEVSPMNYSDEPVFDTDVPPLVPTLLSDKIYSVMPGGDFSPLTNTEIRARLRNMYPHDMFRKCDVNRALAEGIAWGHRVVGKYKHWHRRYGLH